MHSTEETVHTITGQVTSFFGRETLLTDSEKSSSLVTLNRNLMEPYRSLEAPNSWIFFPTQAVLYSCSDSSKSPGSIRIYPGIHIDILTYRVKAVHFAMLQPLRYLKAFISNRDWMNHQYSEGPAYLLSQLQQLEWLCPVTGHILCNSSQFANLSHWVFCDLSSNLISLI